MKIVILGKGGCGKSTVSSLLAKGLARNGLSVLVIDSDESNFGLHRLLGMEEPQELMEHLGGRRDAGRRIMESSRGGKEAVLPEGQFGMEDIPPPCLSAKGRVKLLRVGKVKHFGEGCACPMGVLARGLVERLTLKRGEVAIVDTEAGLEHLGRGVERGADLVLMVLDPTFESLSLMERVTTMMEEAGKPFFLVLNRLRPEYEEAMRERCPTDRIAAVLPEDPRVNMAGLVGEEAPPDVKGGDELVRFIIDRMES